MCSFACGAMALVFLMVVALVAVKHHSQHMEHKWEELTGLDADKAQRDADFETWQQKRAALFSDLRADATYSPWRLQLFIIGGAVTFLLLLSHTALSCRRKVPKK